LDKTKSKPSTPTQCLPHLTDIYNILFDIQQIHDYCANYQIRKLIDLTLLYDLEKGIIMKKLLLFSFLILSTQAHAQAFNNEACIILGNQHVPRQFITYLTEEVPYDTVLQEDILRHAKTEANNDDGKWHQTPDGEEYKWLLAIPDLFVRIEKWRIDNVMSPNFVDECDLSFQFQETGRSARFF
jgi:hypothetical protein